MARRFLSGALGALLRYALVIGMLGGVGYFWYVILDDLVAAERSSGTQINVSGRQRMLSQRINLLAERLLAATDAIERDSLRKSLLAAAGLMETSHDGLINGEPSLGLPGNPIG